MSRLRRLSPLALAAALLGAGLVAPAASPAPAPATSHHVADSRGGRPSPQPTASGTPLPGELYQIGYSRRHRALWVTSTTHRPGPGRVPATSALYRLDPRTRAVEATITPRTLAAGTPEERPEAGYGLAVDDRHDRLWVSATREEAVVVYHQVTGERVATIGGLGHARDIAIDQRRNRAYVSDPINGTITTIDTRTLDVVGRLGDDPVPSFSPMSLALVEHRGRTLLYTVNLEDGALVAHDPRHGTTEVVSHTGGVRASGVAVDPRRGRAYVASQASADLRTVDLRTGAVIATVPASGSALNTAVDPVTGRVYTALFTSDAVLVTDSGTGARITEIATGPATHDVAVAAGRVWAVDQAAGGAHLWRLPAS